MSPFVYISPVKPAFAGYPEQREYETWLRKFSPEAIAAMAPIAAQGWKEYRYTKNEYDPKQNQSLGLLSKVFIHVKQALTAGRKFPDVHRFNLKIIDLHTKRLGAVVSRDDNGWAKVMIQLTDLGRALETVLKEHGFVTPDRGRDAVSEAAKAVAESDDPTGHNAPHVVSS